MTYAYDLWAQMPVRDLYDTLMMAMAINAAKDMYEKGQLELKDFKKEYGDFYSPTQSHMDFYNENFNVGKFLDDLYSHGIDPVRSQEGRAMVQQWINSRPISQLQKYKKSAETYDKFLDSVAALNSKGLYNPEFQDFILGGKNINTLGRGEVWDVSSATPYLNLTLYADPLFKGIDSSFIKTEDGYDIYGVTPERRKQILTATMGDILNTPIGRFHYEKARDNASVLLGRTPTEDEVRNQFAEDVITATKKYDAIERKENPDAKRQKDFEFDDKLDANKKARDYYYWKLEHANTPGYDSEGNPVPKTGTGTKEAETLGVKASVTNTGISLLSGTEDPSKQALFMKSNLRNLYNRAFLIAGGKKLDTFGKDKLDLYSFKNVNKDDWQTFKNTIKNSLQFEISRLDFPQLINKRPVDDQKAKAGIVQIDKHDLNDIMSEDQVITHNYGYYGKKAPIYNGDNIRNYISSALDAGYIVEAHPTKRGLPVLDNKTGEIYNTYEVEYVIINPDGNDSKDTYESVKGYIKDPQRSAYNDVNVNNNPIQNLDVSQKTINSARSSEINSDLEYNAKPGYGVEYSVPGTWVGFDNPVYPLITNP